MEKLTSREQYDEVKARVEQLIAEATAKGLLEPDMDNDYTRVSVLCRFDRFKEGLTRRP